jgi:hypothetical protein
MAGRGSATVSIKPVLDRNAANKSNKDYGKGLSKELDNAAQAGTKSLNKMLKDVSKSQAMQTFNAAMNIGRMAMQGINAMANAALRPLQKIEEIAKYSADMNTMAASIGVDTGDLAALEQSGFMYAVGGRQTAFNQLDMIRKQINAGKVQLQDGQSLIDFYVRATEEIAKLQNDPEAASELAAKIYGNKGAITGTRINTQVLDEAITRQRSGTYQDGYRGRLSNAYDNAARQYDLQQMSQDAQRVQEVLLGSNKTSVLKDIQEIDNRSTNKMLNETSIASLLSAYNNQATVQESTNEALSRLVDALTPLTEQLPALIEGLSNIIGSRIGGIGDIGNALTAPDLSFTQRLQQLGGGFNNLIFGGGWKDKENDRMNEALKRLEDQQNERLRNKENVLLNTGSEGN